MPFPLPLFALPLLIAQVGPNSGIGSQGGFDLPAEIVDKQDAEAAKAAKARRGAVQAVEQPSAPASGGCSRSVDADPAGVVDYARKALTRAIGDQRVRAELCLGMALSAQGQWSEARAAFIDGREAADASDRASRARLGAMAGSAALAEGKADLALIILDPAASDAKAAQDQTLSADIAVDRARALVATDQAVMAGQALSEARAADPANAQAWLLSATLSRRLNQLAEAEQQIGKAAELAPQDPEVGLEAGVIAVLSGHDEAARKSWQSVVALAPQSDAGQAARGYLAQLASAGPAQGAAKP